MSVTIVIANVSKTGTSYFITDVVPSINLPALDERIVTDNHTPEAIQGSARIKELFIAEELWIYVDGKRVVGYPILGPQPPPEFIPASDFEDLLPFQEEVATSAAVSTGGGAAVEFSFGAPAAPTTLFGDVIGPIDSNELTLTGVVPGVYTNASIAVNSKGRVIMASSGGSGNATIIWNETPLGVVDGINDTFTLLFPPDVTDDLILTKNGLVQTPGSGNDFVLSGMTIVFEPGNIPSPGDALLATYQSSSATLTPAAHETLRQLIHFLPDGPGRGFPSGSYREILPPSSPFPTTITWWESAAMLKKIFEKLYTYTGAFPTTIVYNIYQTDGVTIAESATDVITYSGAFETSRTRTIV
jgi:hypothetical protein